MSQKNRYADLARSITERVNKSKDGSEPPPPPAKSMSAPVKMAVQAIHQGDLERRLDQAQKEAGASKLIAIDLIDDSPYQTRKISQEQIEELALNLANNPLSTPVVLRRKGERFELVAGHRRVAAFRHLDRTEIPGVVQDFTDEEASAALYMDNMYNADLPDYEKYLGLVAYQKMQPTPLNQRDLAKKTGFSQPQVARLLSFGKLPKRALEFIDQNRRIVGANVALALVQFDPVAEDELLSGLTLIAQGDLKQTDLVRFLADQKVVKPKPSARAGHVIHRGQDVFAKVLRTKKKITIDVADDETAEWIEATIQEALTKRAGA